MPEMEPMIVPMTIWLSAETTPIRSDTRAPTHSSAQMSLPSRSVPNQCARPGWMYVECRSILSKVYGTREGPMSARRTNRMMMMIPAIPALFLRNRRQTSLQNAIVSVSVFRPAFSARSNGVNSPCCGSLIFGPLTCVYDGPGDLSTRRRNPPGDSLRSEKNRRTG